MRQTKHIAQLANEVLRLTHFVMVVRVLFGKPRGALTDFGV
jgi:hypothetical protein